jgi:hypothetical protein
VVKLPGREQKRPGSPSSNMGSSQDAHLPVNVLISDADVDPQNEDTRGQSKKGSRSLVVARCCVKFCFRPVQRPPRVPKGKRAVYFVPCRGMCRLLLVYCKCLLSWGGLFLAVSICCSCVSSHQCACQRLPPLGWESGD